MHVCQNWGHFEQRKHRTDINETQYDGDGDPTLCIEAANTTLNCNYIIAIIMFKYCNVNGRR